MLILAHRCHLRLQRGLSFLTRRGLVQQAIHQSRMRTPEIKACILISARLPIGRLATSALKQVPLISP